MTVGITTAFLIGPTARMFWNVKILPLSTSVTRPLAGALKFYNLSDEVVTVGIVMTIFNKFRLGAVLMFQTVITMPTVITLSSTLVIFQYFI